MTNHPELSINIVAIVIAIFFCLIYAITALLLRINSIKDRRNAERLILYRLLNTAIYARYEAGWAATHDVDDGEVKIDHMAADVRAEWVGRFLNGARDLADQGYDDVRYSAKKDSFACIATTMVTFTESFLAEHRAKTNDQHLETIAYIDNK